MPKRKLFTIGFTQKDARSFFTLLQTAGVSKIIDVRLNNNSQLAGFSKRDDLAYFLKEICDCDYVHVTDFAPTKEIYTAYKKEGCGWAEMEKRFTKLINDRKIENRFKADELNNACLLCSEHEPLHCHRRLVAIYLQEKIGDIEIIHLV